MLFVTVLLSVGCNDDKQVNKGCDETDLLNSFTTSAGLDIYIYQNGDLYINDDTGCNYELQYFDPSFVDKYEKAASGQVYFKEGDVMVPVVQQINEGFDGYLEFTDLIIASVDELASKVWTNFTLLSPETPSVSEYVTLFSCILDGECDFLDNRIDLISHENNAAVKFQTVSPGADMVTSKSSVSTTLTYFELGDDLWFQCKYYIESGIPYSLVDFESVYFEESPGPRVVISGGQIALENKFGSKILYRNETDIKVPEKKWFTVKLHLVLSDTDNGIIEVWQDENLVISETGINLPTSNAILNSLEVGITASDVATVLLIDDLHLSDQPMD